MIHTTPLRHRFDRGRGRRIEQRYRLERRHIGGVLVHNVPTGTLLLSSDGGVVYTPALNYNGVVTFTYQATDGLALSTWRW